MAIVKWDNRWYIRSFNLAGNGLSDAQIAVALGVPFARYARWIREDQALREGLEEARKPKTGYADFKAFIYEKLPKKARLLWDELDSLRSFPKLERNQKNWRERREAVLNAIEAAPARHQQALFLHALIKCNFIVNTACLETGINPATVKSWCGDEPFRRLVESIQDYKGDFFESCLLDQCRQGDSAAIIFANKTYNRKRGYAPEMNINTNTESTVRHEISVDELPTEAKRAIIAAIRARETPLLEDNRDAMDAEVVS